MAALCVEIVFASDFLVTALNNGSSHGTFHPCSLFLIAPLMKTTFFATVDRDQVPKASKRLVWLSFISGVLGFTIGMFGIAFGMKLLGVILTTLGLLIVIYGFLPLQRVASRAAEQA